jgi:glycolate oxidase iron-sulfur subunit
VRAATLRLLERAGCEVVFAQGEGCCGALVHHMGREADALDAARRNVDAAGCARSRARASTR